MTGTDQDTQISFRDIIVKASKWYKYVLSKWLTILSFGILGSMVGLAYSFYKKSIYTAELSFALEDEKSGGGLGAAMGLASQFGIDLMGGTGGAFSGDNLLALMRSRSMVEKALLTPVDIDGKKQTLAERYIYFNKLRDSWSDDPSLKNVRFLPGADRSKFNLQQDSLLGEFYNAIIKGNLTVDKLDKKLSIVVVAVRSKDQLFSLHFAEILTKTVSDFYISTKTKKSVDNLNILQHQTDSVRRELNAAITGVASSSDGHPNANPALQILRVPSQRRQVDVQANQAILTQLVTNLEVAKVSLRKETPLIQIIDKPILPLEKDKRSRIFYLVVFGFCFGMLSIVTLSVKYLFG